MFRDRKIENPIHIKMKTFIVFALFVAIAAAAPRQNQIELESEPVQILRFENDNIGVGPYNFV